MNDVLFYRNAAGEIPVRATLGFSREIPRNTEAHAARKLSHVRESLQPETNTSDAHVTRNFAKYDCAERLRPATQKFLKAFSCLGELACYHLGQLLSAAHLIKLASVRNTTLNDTMIGGSCRRLDRLHVGDNWITEPA